MPSVLYFASLRDRLGVSRETIALPVADATVATLVSALRERGGAWEDAFRPGAVWRVAVNQQMAASDTPIGMEDEVAFFPPVTGG